MPIKTQDFHIRGMRQDDILDAGNSSSFAYEIKNLRYNTTGEPNQGFWTVEKSSKPLEVEYYLFNNSTHGYNPTTSYRISHIIGSCVINEQYVVICKIFHQIQPNPVQWEFKDAICVITKSNAANYDLRCNVRYIGNLNLDREYPAECLGCYESDDIQKVYWVDGLNQPRMINICRDDIVYNDTSFDFLREVSLDENVTITKIKDGGGMFTSGTVKYAITYFTKYGQETNIVWDSALYYPIKNDRGLNPTGDEFSGDAFRIHITGLDFAHGFDYVRIYSICRSEENTTPIVRVIADLEMPPQSPNAFVEFVDKNNTGYIVDPQKLLFLGGDELVAGTFDATGNRLFLGNITYIRKPVANLMVGNKTIAELLRGMGAFELMQDVKFANGQHPAYYDHFNQLNQCSYQVKVFKTGEWYRFGIQFQDKYGRWSDVVFLKDAQNNHHHQINSNNGNGTTARFIMTIPNSISSVLIANGFIRSRIVCNYTDNSNRTILYQGVVNPTVYSVKWAGMNAPYRMASWFFRANSSNVPSSGQGGLSLPFGHNEYLVGGMYTGSQHTHFLLEQHEIQSIVNKIVASAKPSKQNGFWGASGNVSVSENNDSAFKVDRKCITFNSPEIEDESINAFDDSQMNVTLIGEIPINGCYTMYDLTVEKPYTSFKGRKAKGYSSNGSNGGFFNIIGYASSNDPDDYVRSNGSGGFMQPGVYKSNDTYRAYYYNSLDNYTDDSELRFPLYPFQNKFAGGYFGQIADFRTSIDGSTEDVEIKECDVIESKIFSSLKYSYNVNYISKTNVSQTSLKIFNSKEVVPTILSNNKVYYGNVDSIAPVQQNTLCRVVQGKDGSGSADKYNDLFGNYLTYTCPDVNWHRENYGVSADPVQITYKSMPHYAIELTNPLPSTTHTDYAFLYLAELTRPLAHNPLTDPDACGADVFGQPVDEVLRTHNWKPCGKSVKLNGNVDVMVVGSEGDTYYMRYDCLKTYPFRRTDVNQIVEILSFMVETRINLDGRWDIRRGWLDNTTADNTNFNRINMGYTQSNNMFVQQYLDKWSKQTDEFPNKVIFSKVKTLGEETDTWTNLHGLSSRDVDGTLGEVTKVKSAGTSNAMMVFQEHGVAMLPNGDRVETQSQQGVPLEIANSTEVGMPQYIDRNIGCQNKWSISDSATKGLLWIDDSMKNFYALNKGAEELANLGFNSFLIKQIPTPFTSWNELSVTPNAAGVARPNNFRAYFDKDVRDVLFANNNECLAWNDLTQTFTSLYDYQGMTDMAYLDNKTIVFKPNLIGGQFPYADYGVFYELRGGKRQNNFGIGLVDGYYSNYLGVDCNYWMTLCCTGDFVENGNVQNGIGFDKVFNTVKFIADTFNAVDDIDNITMRPFNRIDCWNNYQDSQLRVLGVEFDEPPSMMRRFNTWRIQLPRANYNLYSTEFADRLRGSHLFIKLMQHNQNDDFPELNFQKVMIKDISVSFDIK